MLVDCIFTFCFTLILARAYQRGALYELTSLIGPVVSTCCAFLLYPVFRGQIFHLFEAKGLVTHLEAFAKSQVQAQFGLPILTDQIFQGLATQAVKALAALASFLLLFLLLNALSILYQLCLHRLAATDRPLLDSLLGMGLACCRVALCTFFILIALVALGMVFPNVSALLQNSFLLEGFLKAPWLDQIIVKFLGFFL